MIIIITFLSKIFYKKVSGSNLKYFLCLSLVVTQLFMHFQSVYNVAATIKSYWKFNHINIKLWIILCNTLLILIQYEKTCQKLFSEMDAHSPVS